MNSKNEIISILDAINEINLRPKKKTLNKIPAQSPTFELNQDLIISPDVDKIIREAEEYKKLSSVSTKSHFIQNKLVDPKSSDTLILTEEFIDSIDNENKHLEELHNKIGDLETEKNKLYLEIENLKKIKDSLSNKVADVSDSEYSPLLINIKKENLESIYAQVKKQKQIFLDLKSYSTKIERDSNVYKENYERLIIENNELKTRLKTTKEQIVNYESNKNDLLLALSELNKIISKSNIVGKISPYETFSENNKSKKP